MSYTINWRASKWPENVYSQYSTTGPTSVPIKTVGATKEEHQKDLDRQLTAINAFDPTSVGLWNRKEDWEGVFGKVEEENKFVFSDTTFPEEKKKPWYKFWQ